MYYKMMLLLLCVCFVRFRMQVMLNGQLFPVVEASSKKVAKKDAAAATLRFLIAEMQGETMSGEDGNGDSGDKFIVPVPEVSVSSENVKIFFVCFNAVDH